MEGEFYCRRFEVAAAKKILNIVFVPSSATKKGKTSEYILVPSEVNSCFAPEKTSTVFNVRSMFVIILLMLFQLEPTFGRPKVTGASIRYDSGSVYLRFNATIDVRTSSLVNLQKILISNITNKVENDSVSFDLSSSFVNTVPFESRNSTVLLYMTEEKRARAVAMSSTNGGDGQAVYIDVENGAFIDYDGNTNIDCEGLVPDEFADALPPTINAAEIDYGTGIVKISASETIDVTPDSWCKLKSDCTRTTVWKYRAAIRYGYCRSRSNSC